MSCVIGLTSAALIAGLTLSLSGSVSVLSMLEDKDKQKEKLDQGFETVFMDSAVLLETLKNEYDCHLNVISENEYDVITKCGMMKYKRDKAGQPFMLYLNDIKNPEGLVENIRSFEVDYGRNVQAYTYGHIKENLSDGMSIASEELLEDDTILLTINVE